MNAGVPVPFHHTIAGLMMGRGGTYLDTDTFEKATDSTIKKLGVEVALDGFGNATSIN